MAATVTIAESNGATPTVTDSVTNLNFGSTDATSLTPASYPITIPSSGTNYSYEKALRIKCTGTYNKVDNLQFWHSAGTPSTGCSYYWSDDQWSISYSQPVNTLSSKADTAVPTSDPGTANIAIDSGSAGSFDSSETAYSQYFYLQMRVADTASPGNVTQVTFTFQYDEQ